jgi:exopolysaccharide biosynthesis polyprenyl glycosylphosphotransferase
LAVFRAASTTFKGAEARPHVWRRCWTIPQRRLRLLAGDLVVLVGTMLVTQLTVGSPAGDAAYLPLWALLLAAVCIAPIRALHAYDPVVVPRLGSTFGRVAVVGALTVCVYSAILYAALPLQNPGWLSVLGVALPIGSFLTWRAAYAVLFMGPAFKVRALVLGAGATTTAVARLLREKAGREYELVEMADQGPVLREEPRSGDELIQVVESQGIHQVILDTAADRPSDVQAALLRLAERNVAVVPAAAVYEALSGQVLLPLSNPPLGRRESAAGKLYGAVKRIVDVVAAVLGLVVLSPLLLMAALAVRLDSAGSLLYWQERIGRGGRMFRLVKLRTMLANAEADGQPIWAQDGDPRITRVGAFLRRSRLDEVPQLWNVVRGEMSLIGPRPERPEFVAHLSSQIPMYGARHVMRPGITGWAQVQYGYGSSVEDALTKLRYDLYYVRHRSPLLDVVILLKTFMVVLQFKGV